MAEIAVVYASKMDSHYSKYFFKVFKEKFLRDLRFLEQRSFYKLVWALVKSEALTEEGENDWEIVKQALVSKAKEMDPEVLTDLLVLSTSGKGSKKTSLFVAIEQDLIARMRQMNSH